MADRIKKFSRALTDILRLVGRDASRLVRIRLVAVVLLVVAAAVLTALGPVALRLIVDGFTKSGVTPPSSPWVLIAAYVLSQWLARTAGEIRGLIYAKAERRMFRALSERLFAHLMQLPLRFHLDRQTGAISQALDNGLQGYQLLLHHTVFTILPVGAQLGTILIVLARLDHPTFLGIFCGALVSYSIAFSFAAITTTHSAERASSAHVDANAAMTDSLINYETVKYFTAEAVVQERISAALSRTETEWVSFYKRYAVNGVIVSTIFACFLALATWFAAREVINGRMTVGDFVLVNAYMLQVMQPVEMLGYAVQGVSQGIAMLGKVLRLFGEPAEASTIGESPRSLAPGGPVGTDDNPADSPSLEFEEVTLAYASGKFALQGVSFVIPAGKTLGIVGPSGAGKSTLVRLLVRLFEPDQGRILVDGKSIADLPLATLRQSIAVVPQDTLLFDETIRYNIAFGKMGSSQGEIERAAKLAHLHDFILSLPHGYDTKVGERGVKLSGGEKQRISIARAALKRPRIYVMDEATSSLDSQTEMAIQSSLRTIARSSTTLIIAHRLSTVIHADEIIVLDKGRIAERGTHWGLLQQGGRYTTLWSCQRREVDRGRREQHESSSEVGGS